MPAVVVICGCWILGLALAGSWGASPWVAGAIPLALVPAALAGWPGVGARALTVGALCAAIAAWRLGGWLDEPPPRLADYGGLQAVFEGRIASLPEQGLRTTTYRFEVDRVDGTEVEGVLLVTLGQYAEYKRGQRLVLEGASAAPPEVPGFDYPGYLARQGIAGVLNRPAVATETGRTGGWVPRRVDDFRLGLEGALQRALPEPEASLASGITLGRDGQIPREMYDDFRRTGLAHILAVSGSNVALLTGMVFLALTPLIGYYRAAIPSFVVIPVYVGVAGLEESVVRAGVMAGIFLAALVLGRQQSGIAALGVAAFGMTAMDPGAAMDVGFQLSFAATGGLIAFGPWLHWALRRGLGPAMAPTDGILRIAAWTVAATVATLPLVWLHFGTVSLAGVIANVVVEPVFAVALGLGMLTALAGLAWEPAGWVAGTAAYYPLAFIEWVAGGLARLPFASIEAGGLNPTGVVAIYAALVALGVAAVRHRPPEIALRGHGEASRAVRRYALAGAAGGLAVAAWGAGLEPAGGPGELEVTVLDVGQGDAILVTTPDGRQVLVDGGASGLGLVRELGKVMPHWDRRIDAVVLTHPQEDHVAGLPEVLQRFQVKTVYDSGVKNDTEAFGAFEREAPTREVLAAGDVLEIGGVEFAVLWPPSERAGSDLNDRSVVIRVTYGETEVLLTGDIERPPQRALVEAGGIAADVLKVPHHGAATSLEAFFEAVDARVALISVGRGNPFGHPREETLEALEGTAVYRTDEDGRVTVRSDGHRLVVDTGD